MKPILDSVLNLFRFHKLKIFVAILSFVVCAILYFPYSDISDRVTAEIAKATQNQVYVQFDDMGFSLFPQPGLKLTHVSVEAGQLQTPLTADAISLAPSLSGLLSFKPGISVEAEGFMKGTVSITTRGLSRTSAKSSDAVIDTKAPESVTLNKQEVTVEAISLELQKIFPLISQTVSANGKLDVDARVEIDPAFLDQPEGEFKLRVDAFNMPSTVLPLQFPLPLPDIKLKTIKGGASLKNGRINVSKLDIGETGDQLRGTLTGMMDVKLLRAPGDAQVSVALGAYDFTVEFTIQEPLLSNKDIGLAFVYLDTKNAKKNSAPNSATYRFRVASSNAMMEPPQISSVP